MCRKQPARLLALGYINVRCRGVSALCRDYDSSYRWQHRSPSRFTEDGPSGLRKIDEHVVKQTPPSELIFMLPGWFLQLGQYVELMDEPHVVVGWSGAVANGAAVQAASG